MDYENPAPLYLIRREITIIDTLELVCASQGNKVVLDQDSIMFV